MPTRKLPGLTPEQVVALQDALLANADQLLTSALAVLGLGNVGLARSLAILGMEESGKAIAIHERRVAMAHAPEGEPFVTDELKTLWGSHPRKLRLVYQFLVQERYYFGTGMPDPEMNESTLGTIERWTKDHNALKQRGFYVDADELEGLLTPEQVADAESLAAVIRHIHQVGWQLRLGEYIEAKGQAQRAPPATEEHIEWIQGVLSWAEADPEVIAGMVAGMREGEGGTPLNNDAYRLKLPGPGSDPFVNLGRPGYEAETRELVRLSEELDEQEVRTRRQADESDS